MFNRSNNGISNQHLFHNVDYVVFTEGGNLSYTKEDIDDGKYSSESIDILYWNKIFESFLPDNKIKFKSIGSKEYVREIAQNIVDDSITHVYAVMDRDFDEIKGTLIHNNKVLYTYGYSWENDVWNINLIAEIVFILSACKPPKNKINKLYHKFLDDIKFAVSADGYQSKRGKSFIPRENRHNKLIECCHSLETRVKKECIAEIIQNQNLNRRTIYAFATRHKIEPKKHCYGHLFGDFCKFLVYHILKTDYNLKTIDKEFLRRIALSNFMRYFNKDCHDYYYSIFN